MDPAQQQQQQYGQHGAGGEGGQLQQTLTPASVVPPPDPERRKIIEKLAEYSVKNGPGAPWALSRTLNPKPHTQILDP
jgi:hypothetical protein